MSTNADSIHHMTLNLIKNRILAWNIKILSSFTQRYNGRHYLTLRNLKTTSDFRFYYMARRHVIIIFTLYTQTHPQPFSDFWNFPYIYIHTLNAQWPILYTEGPQINIIQKMYFFLSILFCLKQRMQTLMKCNIMENMHLTFAKK